jgi:hypothetical protein
VACLLNIFYVSEAVTEQYSSCHYLNLDIFMYKQKCPCFSPDVAAFLDSITVYSSWSFRGGITFKLRNLKFTEASFSASYFHYYVILVIMCRSQWPRVLGHEMCSPAQQSDRGFESHSRHGCLSTFILFVLSCVGIGLATD